jgi:hypothetical protein
LLSACHGIISIFDMTARQSFLLEMVPDREDLANAIALNSTLVNSARLLGPALAGLTIALTSEATCFLLNGVSYIAVLIALVAMKVPGQPRRATTPFRRGLVEGVSYAFHFAPIRSILVMLAFVSFAGIPYGVLLPEFVSGILHRDADTLGFLSAAAGVGALLAAVYLAARKSLKGMGAELTVNCVLLAAALMLFALVHRLDVALASSVVEGFTQMVLTAGGNTVLHTIVDEDKRGRVMSFYMMAVLGVSPAGCLVTGVSADWIGGPLTVLAGGPICLVAAYRFARRLPKLRHEAIIMMQRRALSAENQNQSNESRPSVNFLVIQPQEPATWSDAA